MRKLSTSSRTLGERKVEKSVDPGERDSGGMCCSAFLSHYSCYGWKECSQLPLPSLQGKNVSVFVAKMRSGFWPALQTNWRMWTPLQFININYVPLQVRLAEGLCHVFLTNGSTLKPCFMCLWRSGPSLIIVRELWIQSCKVAQRLPSSCFSLVFSSNWNNLGCFSVS